MHELVWKPLTAHPGRGGMLAELRPLCGAAAVYLLFLGRYGPD